jgi:hypothetical protein
MSIRKWTSYILILGGVVLATCISTLFIYGPIDIEGTLKTEYHQVNNSSSKLIETDFLTLRAPSDWIHIFGGYGEEGDPFGSFQTRNGVISYEYGFYAPDYSEDSDAYRYKVKKTMAGKYQINIATNEKNEMGISIPMQYDMKNPLTFYMDDAVTDNFQTLIKVIEEIEYK